MRLEEPGAIAARALSVAIGGGALPSGVQLHPCSLEVRKSTEARTIPSGDKTHHRSERPGPRNSRPRPCSACGYRPCARR
jgi:hypothetical protein